MFAGPLPRELKLQGARVPARRVRGCPRLREASPLPQAPACPRTRAPPFCRASRASPGYPSRTSWGMPRSSLRRRLRSGSLPHLVGHGPAQPGMTPPSRDMPPLHHSVGVLFTCLVDMPRMRRPALSSAQIRRQHFSRPRSRVNGMHLSRSDGPQPAAGSDRKGGVRRELGFAATKTQFVGVAGATSGHGNCENWRRGRRPTAKSEVDGLRFRSHIAAHRQHVSQLPQSSDIRRCTTPTNCVFVADLRDFFARAMAEASQRVRNERGNEGPLASCQRLCPPRSRHPAEERPSIRNTTWSRRHAHGTRREGPCAGRRPPQTGGRPPGTSDAPWACGRWLQTQGGRRRIARPLCNGATSPPCQAAPHQRPPRRATGSSRPRTLRRASAGTASPSSPETPPRPGRTAP